EIFVMNADGSNQRRLTANSNDRYPTWSPDGTKIAFSSFFSHRFRLIIMNADGSNQRVIQTGDNRNYYDPAWSPDGSKLAVLGGGVIYLINIDGTNLTRITPVGSNESDVDADPAWSPDGSKLAFRRGINCDFNDCWGGMQIWVVNADGSNPTMLRDGYYSSPAWSPDGTKIVFSTNSFQSGDLFVMKSDGSGFENITNTSDVQEFTPSWQAVQLPDNPIDDAQFFVRQHYLDFLSREPDPPGFAAWQAVINNCPGGDTTCDRIHVSSAFFRSPEFQERGYFVYRFYSVGFGRKPDYDEFTPDLAKVSGFLTDAQLEAAKLNFIAEFMNRPAFVTKFNGLDNTAYVDSLLTTAGIPHPSRDSWIAALGNGTRTRAQVLREISESTEVYDKYYNQAFVVMQYFGYLRRQPDALYLNWIAHLDATGDSRSMISGFINSIEYRARFGP
ncbi:MAG: hypothetical protein LC776_15970, partial [Acidobacteria bacterium]|nr:hypothetical protein [Acidobacteriota bacterium]